MENEMTENLRNQLAVAVRSIQWSYAIFWSVSSTQSGVLQWCDGYYNGDIKTRKTVQAVESNAGDHMGLQRSDQLRELYESLQLGEANPQAKRPTAALSPEDLTDAEWYFLVCMSFQFNIDQGLPGKSFAKNQIIWLCNAHRADTKFFTRSLLAKSASIQTIVCFPYSGGVVELGTTELVPEDLNLIQHIKTSFLDIPESVSKIPNHVSNDVINNNELTYHVLNHDDANSPEHGLNQILNCPGVNIGSPNDSSNEFADNLLREESNILEDIEGEASQIQSWPFMDDAISNCLNNNSANSSDCVSQTYEDPKKSMPVSDGKKEANSSFMRNNETEECNNHQNNSALQGNDFHYQSVVSNLLKGSHSLILGPYMRNVNRESSFVSWSKDISWGSRMPQPRNPQKMLKKVLFEVAKMHENSRVETSKQKITTKHEDDNDRNHVLSERKRREKINERFSILGSLVPSGGKLDKVSILDHTIEYMKELERKVEELESYKEAMERESSVAQSKTQDAMERTSDNYGPNGTNNTKKALINKRKACDNAKTGAENKRVLRLRDSDNISVKVSDNRDVSIEVKCSWSERVLFEVMEVISKLNMESETVQSSNNDGVLSLTAKAKFKGLKAASASVIRQALQKVIKKS